MKAAYIDFEFRSTSEVNMELVCCCVMYDKVIYNFWLLDPEQRAKLIALLVRLKDEYLLVGFSIAAEARCLITLGLDPLDFKWIDVRVAFLQSINGLYRRYDKELKSSLLNVQRLCGLQPENSTGELLSEREQHKSAMRDLIIDQTDYTEADQKDILEYCASDITELGQMLCILTDRIATAYQKPITDVLKILQHHSRAVAAIARVEANGIYLNMGKLRNLSANSVEAVRECIAECNKIYPFFEDNKQKYDLFAQYLEEKGIAQNWPKTDKSNKYKMTAKLLEANQHHYPIQTLVKTRHTIQNLRWFRPTGTTTLLEKVGSDNRLRPDYNMFGTITSRNSPPAKTFIFAMSSWLRALVEAPPGTFITDIDFKSQEFLIGALLSQDKNMIESYYAGDIYLHFAKLAGAVPSDATKESHKSERNLFKSTVLGLQYGMGAEKLAHKLTADTGMEVSVSQAKKLKDIHTSVYADYWRWVKSLDVDIRMRGYLDLPDYWFIQYSDQNSINTYRNFPVQGTAQTILRSTVYKALRAGLKVISMVHDSIIIEHTDPADADVLADIMTKTSKQILGRELLLDRTTRKHGDVWVTDKGKKDYDLLGKYLNSKELLRFAGIV